MEDFKKIVVEEFEKIKNEMRANRFCDGGANYIGHVNINGRIYEVTLNLQGDVDEMIVDPLDKENARMVA